MGTLTNVVIVEGEVKFIDCFIHCLLGYKLEYTGTFPVPEIFELIFSFACYIFIVTVTHSYCLPHLIVYGRWYCYVDIAANTVHIS